MAKQGTKKGCEAEIAERKVKSFELRKKGWSYRDIGKELDISRQTAYNDVWDVIVPAKDDGIDCTIVTACEMGAELDNSGGLDKVS